MPDDRSRARSARGQFFRRARRAALAFLLPDSCLHCYSALGPDERHLCHRCRALAQPRQPLLERPIDSPTGLLERPIDSPTGPMRGDPRERTWAFYALEFVGPVRTLVHALKFGDRPSVSVFLADAILVSGHSALADTVDMVVPVPLHAVRQRERGYNQSALIAERVAAGLGLPVAGLLTRLRATRPQAQLGREHRVAGLAGAFRASDRAAKGRHILLLDDVVTTGATLSAARDALVSAGAARVVCVTAAGPPESG